MPKAKAATIVIDTATITPTKYTPTDTINTTQPEGQYITTESFTDLEQASHEGGNILDVHITETNPIVKDEAIIKKIKIADGILDQVNEMDRRIGLIDDFSKGLKAQRKDLWEQYLDALKSTPGAYKEAMQQVLPF